MTDNLTDNPEWGDEEYEIVESGDLTDEEIAEMEAQGEPTEVDIIELLNFLRIYMIQLNARVSTIEDFLTQFVEEVEKAAGKGGEDEPPKPELTVVS